MSKTQSENNQCYHYTNHMDIIDEKSDDSHHNSDDDNPNYSPDNSPYNSEDEPAEDEKYSSLWSDLNDMRNTLRGYDIQMVKSYIKKELSNDVVEIKKEFHNQFDNVNDNDDLKIEVMILLGELGIQINKKEIAVLDETINTEYQSLSLSE